MRVEIKGSDNRAQIGLSRNYAVIHLTKEECLHLDESLLLLRKIAGQIPRDHEEIFGCGTLRKAISEAAALIHYGIVDKAKEEK